MDEKEIYKFIFKVANNQIWVYRPKADSVYCLKRDGNEVRVFGDDFWSLWAKEFNFIPERHEVDFAFLSSDRADIDSFGVPKNFQHSSENTFWSLSRVKDFMEKFYEYDSVQLEEKNVRIWGCGKEVWYLSRFDSFDNNTKAEEGSSIKKIITQNPLPAKMRQIIEDV